MRPGDSKYLLTIGGALSLKTVLFDIIIQGCWNLPKSRGARPKVEGRKIFEAKNPIFKQFW